MRGRVNIMDLFDQPFSRVRELYFWTFNVMEDKINAAKKEQKDKQAQEEQQKKLDEINKRSLQNFTNFRVSPAEQAKLIQRKKAQADAEKKRQEEYTETSSPPPRIDMEDLVDLIEEGG